MSPLMIAKQCTSAFRGIARTTTIACVLAAFAACSSVTPTSRPMASSGDLELRARTAAQAGNFAAAADLYTQLASTVSGSARAGFLLDAARLAADAGDTATSRRRANEARNGASAQQQQAIGVLLARLELLERRPQAALDLLNAIPAPLADAAQTDAAAIRGQALFQLGRPVEAIRVLTEREVWLDDASSVIANQRLIWDGLRSNPPPAAAAPVGDPIVDGWLALAPLTNAPEADLRRALLTWRQTYTTHPAAGGLLAELLAAQRSTQFPSQIALLLPLSSPQRSAAIAIRDGFLAAHLQNSGATMTGVRIYDTNQGGSQAAYLKAQLEGADFIVGPLLRPEVDQVIAQAGFVPTLSLNYSTTPNNTAGSFYQFALAPDDEARTIAAVAAASGAKTALAFVPSNTRGYQIRDAFQAEFAAHGGELVGWNGYEPALQDFSQPIAAMLNVTRSTQRHRRLAANLGVAVQFEARRRQDVDMIFVVADARTARLLTPQLRFYGAGDIPTYATADVFNPGVTGRDNDLNGLIFADAPALLTPDAAATALQDELRTFWPQRMEQVRLYGMGHDAYRLVGALYSQGVGAWPMRGLSGELSLTSDGRVHRSLPLAQFRNGRPVALEAPAAPIDASSRQIGQR